MKKIGILTFANCLNMGALLQAFALNKYLSKKFIVQDITLKNSKIFQFDFFFLFFLELKNIKNDFLKPFKAIKAFYMIYKKYNPKSIKVFKKFANDNILFSPICKNLTDIKKLNFDTIIIGSDQVWNVEYTDGIADKIFFGQGYNTNNLITYAASIGNDKYSNEQEKVIKEYTKSFKAISLREKQNVDYMTDLLNRKVQLVCDPTFLLDKEEYEKLIKKSKLKIKEKYVFVYNINNSNTLTRIVNNLKEKYGYKIFELKRDCKLNNIKFIGPIEFLYLIKNAEYILTDSFHGTAFSIIFEKKFYTYAAEKGKDRYLTILNKADLNDRLINENFKFSKKEIDYKKVKENLAPFIECSKKFLEENI